MEAYHHCVISKRQVQQLVKPGPTYLSVSPSMLFADESGLDSEDAIILNI